MSYFNQDQQDYMNSLALMPAEQKCWCGWYRLGQCPNCHTMRSCAEKLVERCPECWNDGGPDKGPIIHRIGCTRRNN